MTAAGTNQDCAGGYLRVRIGRTQFLMPVTELMQMDPVPGAEGSRPAAPIDDDALVLCLDESLRPGAEDTAFAACRVLLGSGSDRVVIACDAAELIGAEGVKLYALPACMRSPGSVFSAAAALGDNIHGVCRLEELLAALSDTAVAGAPP